MLKDFKKYDIRLTFRAMCMYEAMTEKSFFDLDMDDSEAVIRALYCMFISSTGLRMTLDVFINLINDAQVFKWLSYEFEKIGKFNGQFASKKDEKKAGAEEKKGKSEMKARDLAGFLIVRCGMSPEYVYDRMQYYEIEDYMRAYEAQQKDMYERERLWTYIGISPHIDSKKIKSPEDILKFPWENAEKKSELEKNKELIKKILGNGKRRHDTDPQ